jgi:hypothetical protein
VHIICRPIRIDCDATPLNSSLRLMCVALWLLHVFHVRLQVRLYGLYPQQSKLTSTCFVCLLINVVHTNKCLQMKHHFALMAMFGRMGNSNAFSQRYECMFIMASVSYSLVTFISAGTPKASSPAISGVQNPQRMATRCSLSSCRKQRKHVPS